MQLQEIDIKNYTILKDSYIEEIQVRLIELEHKRLGSKIVYLQNEDKENVFCLSLRTLPSNSNGVAHILEHTVLCGSEKFPVRDPFFLMMRRSLNTYMNAFTGSDFTCYPASSEVEKDFYNLLDIYCDAVFHPKIDKESFLQEGHRLEFADPDDSKSDLTFKGIVFNEMKGALNSAESRLWNKVMELMFPGSIYEHESGGTPEEIPNLTYEQLLEFHKMYYHPSRCTFYFYGNLPLQQHLDFLEEHVFSKHSQVSQIPPLPNQLRLKAPISGTMTYPALEGHGEDEGYVSIGWLTVPLQQKNDILSLEILDTILMGHDGALLKKPLLESGYCKQVFSCFDDEMNEAPYVLIFRGCKASKIKEIEELTLKLLADIAKNPLPKNLIEGAIHQLELQRLEITGNRTPYGLSLFFRSVLSSQNGSNVEDQLCVHKLFDELKKTCLEENNLNRLIETILLDNSHRVSLGMTPDTDLARKEEEEEKKKLVILKESLSKQEEDHIIKQAAHLKDYQDDESLENPDILPKVTLEDVNKDPKDFPLSEYQLPMGKCYHYDCFTNGLLYVQAYLPLPELCSRELSMLKLLTTFMNELGCGGRDYQKTLEMVQEHTGGISTYTVLFPSPGEDQDFSSFLSIRGKSLFSKRSELFSLLQDYCISVDFNDKERISQLLDQQFCALEASLQQSPMSYAISLAKSNLTLKTKTSSHWEGLEYYYFIKSLMSDLDESKIDLLCKELACLYDKVFHFNSMEWLFTCSEDERKQLFSENIWDLSLSKPKKWKPFKAEATLEAISSQGKLITSQVAYNVMAFKTHYYSHPDAPYVSLLGQLLENKTLHTKIREQGGAYGSGAEHNPTTGYFYFYSYRDPCLDSTIEAFSLSVQEAIEGEFDDQDVEEAKLGLLQDIDSPVAPGSRGVVGFGWMKGNKNLELRRQQRKRLVEATKEDLMAVAKKWLLPQLEQSPVISFSGKEFFDRENKKLQARGKPVLNITTI
jgi:presequence protease